MPAAPPPAMLRRMRPTGWPSRLPTPLSISSRIMIGLPREEVEGGACSSLPAGHMWTGWAQVSTGWRAALAQQESVGAKRWRCLHPVRSSSSQEPQRPADSRRKGIAAARTYGVGGSLGSPAVDAVAITAGSGCRQQGGGSLQGEHDARRLAARGDRRERAQRLRGSGSKKELHNVQACSMGRRLGVESLGTEPSGTMWYQSGTEVAGGRM